jgi:hypothetical protein
MIARTAAPAPFFVQYARAAALLLLVLTPLAPFGIVYVPSVLVVPGDVAATARNILASESLFRLGIASTIVSHLISDIFWPLVLYQLLKPVSRTMASLMIIFSFLGLPISLVNELNNVAILAVLRGVGSQPVFAPDQVNALVSLFLILHDEGIKIASIFWGLWLFPYGYLVFRSSFLPQFIGILLMVGCFGYLIPSLVEIVVPNLQASLGLLPALSSTGELVLPLWLAIVGVNVSKWEQRALAPA